MFVVVPKFINVIMATQFAVKLFRSCCRISSILIDQCDQFISELLHYYYYIIHSSFDNNEITRLLSRWDSSTCGRHQEWYFHYVSCY